MVNPGLAQACGMLTPWLVSTSHIWDSMTALL